jgi:hypothetical protein
MLVGASLLIYYQYSCLSGRLGQGYVSETIMVSGVCGLTGFYSGVVETR